MRVSYVDPIDLTTAHVLAGLQGSVGSIVDTSVDGTSINARFSNPIGITIDSKGDKLYITEYETFNIRVVKTSTGKVSTLVTLSLSEGNGLFGIAIDPSSKYLYVTNRGVFTILLVPIKAPTSYSIYAGVDGMYILLNGLIYLIDIFD